MQTRPLLQQRRPAVLAPKGKPPKEKR